MTWWVWGRQCKCCTSWPEIGENSLRLRFHNSRNVPCTAEWRCTALSSVNSRIGHLGNLSELHWCAASLSCSSLPLKSMCPGIHSNWNLLARRAMSTFWIPRSRYYSVEYSERKKDHSSNGSQWISRSRLSVQQKKILNNTSSAAALKIFIPRTPIYE
jgi:hypothetical protein